MNEISADFNRAIILAQNDKAALNKLISEYLPFIKKCAAGVFFEEQARADNLTEAMLAFIHSVRTYRAQDGAFFDYARTVIRNRLIDAARREAKLQKRLFAVFVPGEDTQREYEIARRGYDIAEEQKNFRAEIADINAEFSRWGFTWNALKKNCPKQKRTRLACRRAAQKALENAALAGEMLDSRKLPVKRLALAAGVSEKILDKYRRYIAAIIILSRGDYPYTHSFLTGFLFGGEL
jgi:RNA polymerase sigma factor